MRSSAWMLIPLLGVLAGCVASPRDSTAVNTETVEAARVQPVTGTLIPAASTAATNGEAAAETNGPIFRYEGFKRVQCGNISNVLLRAAHYFSTNEVIYRIALGPPPTPGHFVRIGDFIGEYEIVGAGGRRGDEHLVLRKDEEEYILSRSRQFYASPSTVRRERRRE